MKKCYSLLLILTIVGFCSCKKEAHQQVGGNGNGSNGPVDVYVVGSEWNGPGGNSTTMNVAKYWKNGTAVVLSDGTTFTSTSSITVSGKDVYVAGDEFNASGIDIAEHWKNGNKVVLGDGIVSSNTTSIAV